MYYTVLGGPSFREWWWLHDMNTNLKTQVPARDNGLVTQIEPGSARPLVPAAVPNCGRASDAWWAHIKDLPHYDPAYPYDPRHVYGPDGTDDDAYGKDGVHFMAGSAHGFSIDGSVNEARRLLGTDRVFKDRCLKLPDLGVPETNRYARSGQIMPDVFIQEHPRPGDNQHEVVYDPDNPILFILEVLSRSTFHYDIGPKIEIYRAMGVQEYFLYDPERVYRTGDEPRLWGLRLSADGDYQAIEPLRHEDGQPIYRSNTLGEFRMLDEGKDVHTLQTWDKEQGLWMDPKQAAVLETGAQNILSLLRQQAAQRALAPEVPDTLAAAWQKARWVPDFTEVLQVTSGERNWSILLPPEARGT